MLASLPLLCCCRCALTKVLAHLVDFERWLTRGIPGLLPEQLHALSGLQGLVLLVGEAVGLIVLLIDQLVSITSQAALHLGSIVKFPVKQSGTGGCTSHDSADYRAF